MDLEKLKKLKEEPLKNAVQQEYFRDYFYTQLGNIDFVVAKHTTENGGRSLFEEFENDSLKSILWAEAKQGTSHDIFESFVQLILTIGKEKTFEKSLPPKYIGAFDAEKFAFIEYHRIQQIFYQNDFNWNVTPSNHDTKEFKQLYELCKSSIEENSILFRYGTQEKEFREFIKLNFKTDKDITEKISVTKNNFTFVFQKWSEKVKPAIGVDWEKAGKIGIIAADFFLADLLSRDGESLKDSLYVVLKNTKYELAKKVDDLGFESKMTVGFTDRQKSYKEFWNIYERPPKEEYWDYIIARRDLLVPQDIRERKGSFFTPQIWVEKSQQYLADVLGEAWQDEYYIWDCCAGTGNLLNGLTNYNNVWASTLDKQDVDVMQDRINNGWRMAENHIFQFDFLNDDFSGSGGSGGKIPAELAEILRDEEKRKKLVIYINPPYAEAGRSSVGKYKAGVSSQNKTYEKYKSSIGKASNEIFAQFLIRIYKEIPDCKIGEFSTLKILSGPNFSDFRKIFLAKLEKLFIVPANTFDNVKGDFPIGFFIWNTTKKEEFSEIEADAFGSNGNFIQKKKLFALPNQKLINDWLRNYFDKNSESIGIMHNNKNSFQTNSQIFITSNDNHDHTTPITRNNLLEMCIYHAVRHCIPHTWINHNDQFLFPSDGWKSDLEFQTNCLIYTIFDGKNFISSQTASASTGSAATANATSSLSINHWIPFTREQVGCKKTFKSTFMSDFLKNGNLAESTRKNEEELFGGVEIEFASQTSQGMSPAEGVAEDGAPAGFISRGSEFCLPLEKSETKLISEASLSPLANLSAEAKSVYESALELWKYYHAQARANPDASFYDIRKHFQGESGGRMNNSSDDEKYNKLIADLRGKMKTLAKKIEVKVYEYGFLK